MYSVQHTEQLVFKRKNDNGNNNLLNLGKDLGRGVHRCNDLTCSMRLVITFDRGEYTDGGDGLRNTHSGKDLVFASLIHESI